MSLLFYDRNVGHGELYNTDGQGGINQLKSYNGWRTSWSQIVPSYATDNTQSETTLLFYDKNSGVAQFYKMDAQGNITQLSDSTYSKGWSHIIPGYFAAGSSNTALLFYNSDSGLAQFYSTDGQGGITQLSNSTYSKGWTHIVPGYFVAGLSNTGLLFYNSGSGLAQFYSTDGQGGITQLSSSTYSKGWSQIVDIPGGPSTTPDTGNPDELLFYNGSSGLAQFYRTDGQGSITQLSSTNYRKGWALIEWLTLP